MPRQILAGLLNPRTPLSSVPKYPRRRLPPFATNLPDCVKTCLTVGRNGIPRLLLGFSTGLNRVGVRPLEKGFCVGLWGPVLSRIGCQKRLSGHDRLHEPGYPHKS